MFFFCMQGDTTKGDSDGELMIDEGGPPSLPPVLKSEIAKSDITEVCFFCIMCCFLIILLSCSCFVD